MNGNRRCGRRTEIVTDKTRISSVSITKKRYNGHINGIETDQLATFVCFDDRDGIIHHRIYLAVIRNNDCKEDNRLKTYKRLLYADIQLA